MKGRTFGRLLVVRLIRRKPRAIWRCQCRCGTFVNVRQNNLKSGNTTSCGCAHVQHGHARKGNRSPEYVAWQNMQGRCRSDRNYRGRIRICSRWRVFANFIADMGQRPSPLHTVERVDNEAGYSPKNCVWATREAQQNNRRNSVLIEVDGERLSASQWSRRFGRSVSSIRHRLRSGLEPRVAVGAP